MSNKAKINLISGLPDDASVHLRRILPDRDFYHLGTASFAPKLQTDLQWHQVWVGPGAPASSRLAPGPVVNYIADPDLCGKALEIASKAARTTGRLWFNHPDRIKETGRDRVSTLLQGIAGVDMPKAIRSRPKAFGDIFADIRENNLEFPVLVRPAGEHGGKTLARLDGAGLEHILSAAIGYAPNLYVTEYRNFVDPDGLFRRYRLAVVGGDAFIKSVLAGSAWNLHAADRVWNEETIAEERRIIETFESELKPKIKGRIGEIYRRLGLDFFGIDCSVRPNGDLTIFEANANMDMLVDIKLQPDLWSEPTHKIKTALLSLIDNPERWVSPSSVMADGAALAVAQS